MMLCASLEGNLGIAYCKFMIYNLKSVDHINTLWITIEQSSEYRSDLHRVFVDFEKAFDSVDREGLWMALRRNQICVTP